MIPSCSMWLNSSFVRRRCSGGKQWALAVTGGGDVVHYCKFDRLVVMAGLGYSREFR